MRIKSLALSTGAAALVLVFAASDAHAFNYVNGGAASVNLDSDGNLTSVTQTGAPGSTANMNGGPDGTSTQFTTLLPTPYTEFMTLTFDVTGHGFTAADEKELIWSLYTGNTPGPNVQVTQIVLGGGVGTATAVAANGASGQALLANGENQLSFFAYDDRGGYSGTGSPYTEAGGFTYAGFTTVTFTIRFQRNGGGGLGGAILQVDAISNPEPGTMALLGMGLLGLGGVVARRRRKRRAAKTASEASTS